MSFSCAFEYFHLPIYLCAIHPCESSANPNTPMGPHSCPSHLCHHHSSRDKTHLPLINWTHSRLYLGYLDMKLFISHLCGTLLPFLQICCLPSLSVVASAKCPSLFTTSVDRMNHSKFSKSTIELKHLARNLIYVLSLKPTVTFRNSY